MRSGERHGKAGAFSRATLHLNSSSVRRYYFPGDSQSETYTGSHAGHLVETLENMR